MVMTSDGFSLGSTVAASSSFCKLAGAPAWCAAAGTYYGACVEVGHHPRTRADSCRKAGASLATASPLVADCMPPPTAGADSSWIGSRVGVGIGGFGVTLN